MLLLLHYLSEDNCPVTNLFLDWNPIYSDNFIAGDRVPNGANQLYHRSGHGDDSHDELSLFAKILAEAKKL